jgi:hypothetical protein
MDPYEESPCAPFSYKKEIAVHDIRNDVGQGNKGGRR